MMEVLVQIDRMLNAILVDFLPEITMPVEQPNGHEFQVEIAR